MNFTSAAGIFNCSGQAQKNKEEIKNSQRET
jgi:hypothetical protein